MSFSSPTGVAPWRYPAYGKRGRTTSSAPASSAAEIRCCRSALTRPIAPYTTEKRSTSAASAAAESPASTRRSLTGAADISAAETVRMTREMKNSGV